MSSLDSNTNTNTSNLDEKKTFNVDCRGTMIKTKVSYLDRIDLLKTMVDLSNENYTIFLDYSPNTYHEYLDYLRDIPFRLENAIPNSIKSLYNYLNTDCLERNRLLEEEEKEKKEIFKNIETKVSEWKTKWDYKEELKKDLCSLFQLSLELSRSFYNNYKSQIDKIIKEKRKYQDIVKYCDIRYFNCDNHLFVHVWNQTTDIEKEISINNAFFKCSLCKQK
jgi:hypothetical protein